MADLHQRDRRLRRASGSPACAGCIHEIADGAGHWAATSSTAHDPWDEVARQREIHEAALAIVEAARHALVLLASRSQAHRRLVSCDQDDWDTMIEECFSDLVGDTFGCLPRAIHRATRELAVREEPF